MNSFEDSRISAIIVDDPVEEDDEDYPECICCWLHWVKKKKSLTFIDRVDREKAERDLFPENVETAKDMELILFYADNRAKITRDGVKAVQEKQTELEARSYRDMRRPNHKLVNEGFFLEFCRFLKDQDRIGALTYRQAMSASLINEDNEFDLPIRDERLHLKI
ncbi:hypothetical protein Ciccas_002260 [Cichlidogyrus casuarinus]|uniref:Uncharacterized protein n=1 Tax=Cichlidogyrus casuarinus TaxID=1844966 RepID=A0ABD2QI15_9PLAT